jgi:hypothetical protein
VHSCNKKEKRTDTLGFTIDSTLLETTEFKDRTLNLSYRVPLGYKEVVSKNNRNIKNTRFDSISSLPLVHRSYYFCEKEKSILIVSFVKENIGKNEAVASLKKYSKNTSLWQEANFTKFSNNKIVFNQFLLQSNEYIVFKLLFSQKNKLLEMNYIIPKLSYTSQTAKQLESSIGSIKSINY